LKIAILKETKEGERRVALTPGVIKTLIKAGFNCSIQKEAGIEAGFYNEAYTSAGATVLNDTDQLLSQADVVLKVNAPSVEEIMQMKEGAVVISFLYAYTIPGVVESLVHRKISSFSIDAIPVSVVHRRWMR
jgi:NAD(P) transhydrogenase subunit alpha